MSYAYMYLDTKGRMSTEMMVMEAVLVASVSRWGNDRREAGGEEGEVTCVYLDGWKTVCKCHLGL